MSATDIDERDWDRFEDMLEYAQDAVGIVGDLSSEALINDRLKCLASCRAVEIVGEAASKISEAGKLALPNFPWKQAIGMRQILAHDYGRIQASVVVEVTREHLPQLITSLQRLLKDAPQ